jgi:hypothetical protein
MELNLNGLPNDAIHIFGHGSKDAGIVKLNVVSQVDAVFSHGCLVWMFKTDVPLVLLQPRVHGTACLPNADLAALTGNYVRVYRLCHMWFMLRINIILRFIA